MNAATATSTFDPNLYCFFCVVVVFVSFEANLFDMIDIKYDIGGSG